MDTRKGVQCEAYRMTSGVKQPKLKIAWITMADDKAAGYGKIGFYLPAACEHAGIERVNWRSYDWDWRIIIGGPRAWPLGKGTDVVSDYIGHHMFEACPLPPDWVPVLNRCAAIWTPAQWNVEVFRESGVTAPVFVAGYGVNDNLFHPMRRERSDDEPYTFLWAGTSLGDGVNLGDRKGGELVIKAFRGLNLPNARLILKVTIGSTVRRVSGDPRIMIISSNLGELEYAALIASADCFVYPSRGEGFGLQPLEAMAAGLPVIAPAYSGMADFIESETAIVLPVRGEMEAHLYKRIYDYPCVWADIRVDDVADRMRWAYDHQGEARAIGCRAAAHVKRRWTWRDTGRKAVKELCRLAKGV
jgi:glycosyltransferase involved in cell wall biosynthesis